MIAHYSPYCAALYHMCFYLKYDMMYVTREFFKRINAKLFLASPSLTNHVAGLGMRGGWMGGVQEFQASTKPLSVQSEHLPTLLFPH